MIDWIKFEKAMPIEGDLPFLTYKDGEYQLWEDSDWFLELTEKERLEYKQWLPLIPTKRMSDLHNEIVVLKQKLLQQAKEQGLSENFGQTEVSMIENKYDYNSLRYGSTEDRQNARVIEMFNEWCQTITDKNLQ